MDSGWVQQNRNMARNEFLIPESQGEVVIKLDTIPIWIQAQSYSRQQYMAEYEWKLGLSRSRFSRNSSLLTHAHKIMQDSILSMFLRIMGRSNVTTFHNPNKTRHEKLVNEGIYVCQSYLNPGFLGEKVHYCIILRNLIARCIPCLKNNWKFLGMSSTRKVDIFNLRLSWGFCKLLLE